METLIMAAAILAAAFGTWILATRRGPITRQLRTQDGAMSTEYALLMGVGAVVVIAIGAIVYNRLVNETVDCVDLDWTQVSQSYETSSKC